MQSRLGVGIAAAGFAALAIAAEPGLAQEQAAGRSQARVISIEEAIATAVGNSPVLAAARDRVNKSRNQVREARAQSNFRVDTTLGYSRTGPSSTITFPGPGGEPQTIRIRPPSSTTANGTLTQPVDISGRLSLARGLAGLQLRIQEFGEAQTLQQLIADVKSAYYSVLRAEAGVEVAQAAVTVAEERLRIARVQFEAGVAPKFDVTRAEVDVANLKQTLIQAQNGVELAKAALNRTTGVEVNRPVEVQPQEVPIEPVTVDIAAGTNKAFASRPEMGQATTGLSLAQRGVKFAATDSKLSLGLFVSTDWTSQTSVFSTNRTTYMYGANVTWPIWTGGVTKARVAQARNDVDIARDNLRQARLGVELDVRNSALNVMEASRRVGTAQANVGQAEEALRLARVRYQEGVSTQVEVQSAEAALTQARTNLVNSRYDYLTAQAQLERATASQPEYHKLTSTAPTAVVSQGVTQ